MIAVARVHFRTPAGHAEGMPTLSVYDLAMPLHEVEIGMVIVETDQERLVIDVHRPDKVYFATRYPLPGAKRRPWDGKPLYLRGWSVDPEPGRRWRHKVIEIGDGPQTLRITGVVHSVRVMPDF